MKKETSLTHEAQEDIRKAIDVMRHGGIILYPTDAIWGIGCDATNAEAVSKIYKIKQRADAKALITLVDSEAKIEAYVQDVPTMAWELIENSSKPLTIIMITHAIWPRTCWLQTGALPSGLQKKHSVGNSVCNSNAP